MRRELKRDKVVQRNAGVGRLQVLQASDEQAGAEQQQEAERDLRRDEPFAQEQRAAAAGNRSHRVPERRPRIRATRANRGNQPEDDAGRRRQHNREREDPQVRARRNRQRLTVRRHECQQGACQRDGESNSNDTAERREHAALDEHLTDQTSARCPERQSHREPFLPHECARDQQVRDVRACNQQDETDHAHQDDEPGREIVPQRREPGRGAREEHLPFHELIAEIRGPVLRRRQRELVLPDPDEQQLQRRSGALDGVSRLEAREDLDPARAPIVSAHPRPFRQHYALHQNRHADLRRLRRIEAAKFGGRHADDVHRVVVDEDLLADDVWIARKAADPIVVAEYDDGMAAWSDLVRGQKRPPSLGTDAEDLKVIARHELAEQRAGASAAP